MTTIASWYHCSVKPISRSSGRTAVAAAAYRSGERLHDKQLEKTYDYTMRRGVEASFIVAPENAPGWTYNLQELWNRAQEKDNRVNSRMAREIELALPDSLDLEERVQLARDFANHLVDRYDVAVFVALHKPGKEGDQRNHHAHIMMTTRRIDENGFGAKTRELDDAKRGPQEVEYLREYAATLINEYLENYDIDERVDHRSFADRGLPYEPTRHLGPQASAMERRGERTALGDVNREIISHNQIVKERLSDLAATNAEIAEELEQEFLPILPDNEPDLQPAAEPEEEPTLTWEEQRAAAQDAFNCIAEKAYEDLIFRNPKEELSQATVLAEHGEQMSENSRDVFNSASCIEYERAIAAQGEIREFGLGKSWYDRTVTMFENLYYDTIDYVKNSFQKYFGRTQVKEQERDDYGTYHDR